MKAIEVFPYCNDLRDCFYDTYAALTEDQINWKPDNHKNNIAFLLRHVAQAEDWFVRSIILGQDMVPKRKAELPTVVEILDYLKSSREQTLNVLTSMTVEDLSQTRSLGEGFRGGAREGATIHWIFNRMFQHESYHYGQVNMLMRLQGLEPPKM